MIPALTCIPFRALYVCLQHDFKVLYDSTMEIIRKNEKASFAAFTAVAKTMRSQCQDKCPRNPADLFDLYASGRAAYDLFHAFLGKAARACGAYCFMKSDNTRPGMKGIYRVLEKGIFKYNKNWRAGVDLSQVHDLVRGGIIANMDGLTQVAQYFLDSDEVTVHRIKDRFNEPSSAGWTDMMINFSLNDDAGRHPHPRLNPHADPHSIPHQRHHHHPLFLRPRSHSHFHD